MTNKRLGQLYYLNREVQRLKERVEQLESVAEGTTSRITGLPRGMSTSDRVGNIAILLAEARDKLKAAQERSISEYAEVTAYIEDIEDPFVRQIMQYRHVNHLPWSEVAELVGGGNTAESVRQIHKRYLDKQDNMSHMSQMNVL